MRYLLILLTLALLTGCSIKTVDMAPTVQKYDLTDDDKDGVILARDKCVQSNAGARVNNDGCGKEKIQKMRRELKVNFASNSSVVRPQYYGEIKALAEFMKKYPSTHVTIEGHTSKVGSRAYNQKLSERRAEAIKEMLINSYGIAADRISAVGYGLDRLLDQGDNESAHARNRRIVAEISSEKQIEDMKWTIYTVDQENE